MKRATFGEKGQGAKRFGIVSYRKGGEEPGGNLGAKSII
jgi:hypothetical protein